MPAQFTPAGNCYELSFSTTSSNLIITGEGSSAATVFKIDNQSGNLVFVNLSSNVAIGNITHPTPGTGNSKGVIPVRTGDTVYLGSPLGTFAGNVLVSAIAISGTGNIFITPGV